MIRNLRPLAGHPEERKMPLLNTTSFLSGNFFFYVRLAVQHKSKILIIQRVASGETGNDMRVTLEVNNHTDKKMMYGADAQDFLETQILPNKLSQFFFIDGESIAEYRALIQSGRENVTIRNNIEDILNYPILKKGVKDFQAIKTQYEQKYFQLTKSSKKNNLLRKKIDELDLSIGVATQRFNKAEVDFFDAEEKIEKLEDKMKLHSSSEKLIIQKKAIENLLLDYKDDLNAKYNSRRFDNEHLWINILQPSLRKAIDKMKPRVNQFDTLRSDIMHTNSKIEYLKQVMNKDKICCPTCDQLPLPRDSKLIEKDKKNLLLLNDKIIKIEESLVNSKEIRSNFMALQEFKALSRIGIINEHNKIINKIKGKIEDQESILKEINNSIGNIDEESIIKIRNNIENLVAIREEARHKKIRNQRIIDQDNSDKSRFLRDMVHEDEFKAKSHNKNIKIIQYFEKMWEIVLDEYSQQTRKDVERIASETFMKITNNKDGLSGIILNENFGLTVLDTDKLPVQAVTPGMMQCAAISLIDSLRQLSNIVFPILFDTPGQSIDKTHRQNIVNYFWTERDIQFIIIPSSGEYDMEETEIKYNHLLAKTWELDFDSSANKTKVRNRLCN